MRLLFLSNFYPPAALGGYEAWCGEVAMGLRERGHEVLVLTSRHRRAECARADPAWVRRDLHLEQELAPWVNYARFFAGRGRRGAENRRRLRQVAATFRPDGIMIWGLWNLDRRLAALAEELRPGRTIYYLGDYWLTLPGAWRQFWQSVPRRGIKAIATRPLAAIAGRMLETEEQPVSLRLDRVLCCSRYLRDHLADAGVVMAHADIVPGGVDTRPYRAIDRGRRDIDADGPAALELLFVGRLVPDKGAHTAVEALARLARGADQSTARLTLVGSGPLDYRRRLEDLAVDGGVADRVRFLGSRLPAELPNLYAGADVLLFPSIWPEPFGRVLVEAMAAGLPVVGTAVGGAGEVLQPEETALVVPPETPRALAEALALLAGDPVMRSRLGAAGRRRAITHFDSRRMVTDLESAMCRLVA